MIQSSDLLRKILSNVDIKTATIKECMVTNITYIFIKSNKTPQYINELNHIRNYPLEQYDKFKEGDNIVTIIHAFKILLDQRGKSFLENKWGIKVDEIRNACFVVNSCADHDVSYVCRLRKNAYRDRRGRYR